MNNITVLPDPDSLAQAIENVNIEIDLEKRGELYKTLADRVIEHSDAVKEMGVNG